MSRRLSTGFHLDKKITIRLTAELHDEMIGTKTFDAIVGVDVKHVHSPVIATILRRGVVVDYEIHNTRNACISNMNPTNGYKRYNAAVERLAEGQSYYDG